MWWASESLFNANSSDEEEGVADRKSSSGVMFSSID